MLAANMREIQMIVGDQGARVAKTVTSLIQHSEATTLVPNMGDTNKIRLLVN